MLHTNKIYTKKTIKKKLLLMKDYKKIKLNLKKKKIII